VRDDSDDRRVGVESHDEERYERSQRKEPIDGPADDGVRRRCFFPGRLWRLRT